jgi:hypothetical protein
MYIFYLDDSGSTENPQEQHLVLGGISVYERHTYWFTQELDKLAAKIDSANPQDIEFHASEIFAGRKYPWDRIKDRKERIDIIKEVLYITNKSYDHNSAFACVVHKNSYPQHDAMELAFEDLCSRFCLHLGHKYEKSKTKGTKNIEKHKGIIVLDESSYEKSLQKIGNDLRCSGTRWGNEIRDLAEVPLFANSKTSRLIQIADHIAYAVFRRYEASDTQYLDIILPKFDNQQGVLHGLVHKTTAKGCLCPACMSRQKSN